MARSSPSSPNASSITSTCRSISTSVGRQCSTPLSSLTIRLLKRGCWSIVDFRTSDFTNSTSMGFFNPITQWITCFVSSCRNSLPAGVRGSSLLSPILSLSLPLSLSLLFILVLLYHPTVHFLPSIFNIPLIHIPNYSFFNRPPQPLHSSP